MDTFRRLSSIFGSLSKGQWREAGTATKKRSPTQKRLTDLREWASHITAETRGSTWIDNGYIMPNEVSNLCRKLANEQGSLHALIGYQGVGKTSALLAIAQELRKPEAAETEQRPELSTIFFFKWRRPRELIPELLNRDDTLAFRLKRTYAGSLIGPIQRREPPVTPTKASAARKIQSYKAIVEDLASFKFTEIERMLGRGLVERLKYEAFLEALTHARTILIDLPDYSKTDMRRVTTDLETIYWIWNELAQTPSQPNIVISFQKELFHGHFFLGKMNRIDLKPFKPETLLKFYEKEFRGPKPFTQEALVMIAKMSRGIFRRFLRYITLTLNHQERAAKPPPITIGQVHEAIPPRTLAQDMDQQLTEIFPRQPDQRIQATKLLLHLEEHGPTDQAEIAQLLDLPEYAVTRLLNKLEDSHYIQRERKGLEKTVSLTKP